MRALRKTSVVVGRGKRRSKEKVGCRSEKERMIVSGPDSVDPDSDGLRRFTTCILYRATNYPIVAHSGIFGFRPAYLYGYPSRQLLCESCLLCKSPVSMKIYDTSKRVHTKSYELEYG